MIVAGMQDIELQTVLDDAIALKAHCRQAPPPQVLVGKSVLLVFEKNSTRTRVSFELGLRKLGASVGVLDAASSQLARGESAQDTGAVLGRYADLIVHRAKDHATMLEMATHANVPYINALTDVEHPCQVLADLMTLQEQWGTLAGHTMAYVGDGNNMCHSYLLGAALAGIDLHVATPPGFDPDPAIVQAARQIHEGITVGHDPKVAVKDAHAVATDTWINMGDEDETALRLEAFAGFTVDEDMMALAAPDALFLHCLPGHWGHEATDAVAHGPQSVIYEEAENRMWVQMALAARLLAVPLPVEALA